MPRLLPLLLIFLALAPALRAQDSIWIATKFIETSIAVTPPLDAAALARVKDVDLLSAPRVCVKPDQKATVEITHEQALPAGEIATQDTAKSGVTLEAQIHPHNGMIAYRLRVTKCDLTDAGSQSAGVLETVSRDIYATGEAREGEPVWLRFALPKTGRQVLVQVTFTRGKV